jgi:hypothetical protein
MRRKVSKKRGPVVSKKVTYDGIDFKSGLEKYMYIALKSAGIHAVYEGKTFELVSSFKFSPDSYERQANGKGEMINRGGKKHQGIKYTPDFIGEGFIIECKGRANESFPIRWKLFKDKMKDSDSVVLYKPQSQKECDEVVRLILKERENG